MRQFSSEDCSVAIATLASLILTHLGAVPLIVGIGRRGEAPARKIAHRLGAPVVIITARRQESLAHTRYTGTVSCDLTALHAFRRHELLAGPILLVDDICNSGATLTAALAAIQPLTKPDTHICTATLCRTSDADPRLPDLHVWDVPTPLVAFPWTTSPSTPIRNVPSPEQPP
ncbi:phosphoribosyltransferase [Nonomuraea sp. NPDC049400]|uniref:phosphoribosyltransferase n=1 Tax=Nonomuraea sp. NPDC049400 TaxID=3364352 RepID=UPI0037A17FB4